MTDLARITLAMNDGELLIYVNEEGRQLLISELSGLSRRSDHSHFGTWEGAEVELRSIPYSPGDTIIHAAKIMLRPDDWDREYFPHVFDGDVKEGGN